MTAFDRIESGIPTLDPVYDNIRLGDNVVWQLTSLDDFQYFYKPFVDQALRDGRNLIYIRFASHEPLLEPTEGLKIYEFDPNEGFETFTVAVRRVITKEGIDAFYVFDCLSELQVAWSSDMMMGNFFRVTCPYLFELDTVAYFPILRGRHSFSAVAKIRDTTQLFTDVYQAPNELFIHPLKVWNRSSATMFLPHSFNTRTGMVEGLTDGVGMSRFYAQKEEEEQGDAGERNIDSWDRFFIDARREHSKGSLDENACVRMCHMMMTKDERMRPMVNEYFGPEDYFAVRNRMVGTGLVGGKSCGMLLARKIVERDLPEAREFMEPHDSFYVGTDVFYTYIVYNDLWKLRISQQSGEGFIEAAPALQEGILKGTFPPDIREHFMRIIDYYGQVPIIVRSSSFLEDGFGNAFAGKYESAFCPNVGDAETRLAHFEDAVRYVYASSLDRSALEYRVRNGLDAREEQMSLLVQRVSGSHLAGGYYLPTAAGVGYSHSAYCWMQGMDPAAGMLRLVMGLGTKAVDRTGKDYPRIVSLDRPTATTAKTVAEKHRFSQRYANLIDLNDAAFAERLCTDLAPLLSEKARAAVMEHDRAAESTLRARGAYQPVLFASCEGLVNNRTFVTLMRNILTTLQKAYDNPVDIEYTVNVGEDGSFVLNLLQCRPLQALAGQNAVQIPEADAAGTVFHIKDASMGSSRVVTIDTIAYVDPEAYYNCPYRKKPQVAALIGMVNKELGNDGLKGLLLAPGRIGTSSPELGVPVSFADLCNFEGLCEVGYSGAGYAPELSYGSHMFQDLVEANIYYGALFEDPRTIRYNPDKLRELDFRAVETDDPELQNIVFTVQPKAATLKLYHDTMSNETLCAFAN
ncbi:MAG: hypothetical protein IJH88_09110 [Eggerthellaceae bacterium]|nr:hypothetical protein [Eggerthellaceae bacterium]